MTYTGWFAGQRWPQITINHTTICQRKLNLTSTFLGRCGDNWVTEDTEIGFSPPGDTDQYYAPCS
jgi:hypothetical protein